MTTSTSVEIRIYNEELTFNNLPFIGNWSCTDRRVSVCVAGQTPKRRLVLPADRRSSRHLIVRKLLWGVTPVHVEGKQTAIFSADVIRQALHLSRVIMPDGTVAP